MAAGKYNIKQEVKKKLLGLFYLQEGEATITCASGSVNLGPNDSIHIKEGEK